MAQWEYQNMTYPPTLLSVSCHLLIPTPRRLLLGFSTDSASAVETLLKGTSTLSDTAD